VRTAAPVRIARLRGLLPDSLAAQAGWAQPATEPRPAVPRAARRSSVATLRRPAAGCSFGTGQVRRAAPGAPALVAAQDPWGERRPGGSRTAEPQSRDRVATASAWPVCP